MPEGEHRLGRSIWAEVHGPVHVVDFGGRGRPLVLVHGLGHSYSSWLAAAPQLAEHSRVIAIDLAGFGLTPLGRRSAAVDANARLVGRVIEQLVREPAIMIGNSMGAVVSMLHARAQPASVAGLVLVNPGVPKPRPVRLDRDVQRLFASMALPLVGEAAVRRRWERLGPEGLTREGLALCCVDPSRVTPDVRQAMIDTARSVANTPGAKKAYVEALRSLLPLLAAPDRYRRLIESVRQPVLLIHGKQDKLVPLASARAIADQRPDWDLELMSDVGHVPQLEAPGRFTALVRAWLDGRFTRPDGAPTADEGVPESG